MVCFNGINFNLRGLFNAKAFLLGEQQCSFLTHSWEDMGVQAFPKGISLKVNVIAWLEFELTHYDVAVQYRGIRGFMSFPRVFVLKWT